MEVKTITGKEIEKKFISAVLQCNMSDSCNEPVGYIDNKGFIYCDHHGKQRQMYRPCRKLRNYELNRLLFGQRIKKY